MEGRGRGRGLQQIAAELLAGSHIKAQTDEPCFGGVPVGGATSAPAESVGRPIHTNANPEATPPHLKRFDPFSTEIKSNKFLFFGK